MIPSTDSIRRAGEILREIENLQNQLASLFNGSSTAAVAPAKRRGRPPGTGKANKTATKGQGRTMSPEGRARIAAAAKARWARFHAAQKKKAVKA